MLNQKRVNEIKRLNRYLITCWNCCLIMLGLLIDIHPSIDFFLIFHPFSIRFLSFTHPWCISIILTVILLCRRLVKREELLSPSHWCSFVIIFFCPARKKIFFKHRHFGLLWKLVATSKNIGLCFLSKHVRTNRLQKSKVSCIVQICASFCLGV